MNGERIQRQIGRGELLEAVYEQKQVMRRYNDASNFDLYLWDPVEGEQVITTAPGLQQLADIHGETVVYEDYGSGIPQVCIWDPVSGARRISPTTSNQTNPRVWGDTVVWEDNRNSTYYNPRTDVYMWNPRDGETKLSNYICSMISPAIYGDRVTMWVSTSNTFEEDRGLWEWTSQHGLRQLAQRNYDHPYDVMYTRMWGDLVVWQSGLDASTGVGAWDPVNGFTRVNQSAIGTARMPSVYGNKVAWVGNRDVYLSTLVPEPSSLMALVGCSSLLGILLRRKREM